MTRFRFRDRSTWHGLTLKNYECPCIADVVTRAPDLPLSDAAEYLWAAYCNPDFDFVELSLASPPPPGPTRVAFLIHEANGTPDTNLFSLLKKAYPEAADHDIQQSIRIAVNKEKIAKIFNKMSKLPLCDAAYFLWHQQFELTRAENLIASSSSAVPASIPARPQYDPSESQQAFRKAMLTGMHERTGAPDTKMFSRLRQAHPDASDPQIQQAIKAAMKFEADCFNAWRGLGQHNVLYSRAVDDARKQNPGFTEETYKQAVFDLAVALR